MHSHYLARATPPHALTSPSGEAPLANHVDILTRCLEDTVHVSLENGEFAKIVEIHHPTPGNKVSRQHTEVGAKAGK